MGQTLYEKVFDRHAVRRLPSGQYQLLMGLHLIHEVTSPQAFAMLRERGLRVLHPERTFATVDHIIPTHSQQRPLADAMAEEMLQHLERNCRDFGITFFAPTAGEQGIVHVIGPELGLTQPGMTICCGDSHTSTHGAFGAIALGIGTSQVRDVLATQCLAMERLKVRRIEVNGRLRPGVYAKDVILSIIAQLGVYGGVGYAYEYAGDVLERFSMEERMTVCNMSIEGGARCGYVNPDATTADYLRGRPHAPAGAAWDRAVADWASVRSDPDAAYDDVVRLDGATLEPVVTWGITPGQSAPIGAPLPAPAAFTDADRTLVEDAYRYMHLAPGRPLKGTKIDVAFVGSCTNGRVSDFEEIVRHIQGRGFKVAKHVKALIVPGSQAVRRELVRRGYDAIFRDAGFEFREAGCSMCLAMNPDQLEGTQLCASSSNRNFKGRQGSPTGRTLLMSPVMVAAAAIAGEVADARELFALGTPTAGGNRMTDSTRPVITGPALPLRGHDIDTDRIIPARFLKCVVFDGLGEHAFEDDRRQERGRPGPHPFDDPRYAAARILLVNRNFGCGSSREHAPQAIMRFGAGIQAVVGESFAEIFFGNCVANGVPCVTVDEAAIATLMRRAEEHPATVFRLDLVAKRLTADGLDVPVTIPDGARQQLVQGSWDTTGELLEGRDAVARVAAKLPYFRGWTA